MIQRGDKIKVLDHGHVIFLDSMGSDRSISRLCDQFRKEMFERCKKQDPNIPVRNIRNK